MKKQKLFKALAVFMSMFMVFSVTACSTGNSGDKIVDDANTLNVRIRKAGYGTTYLDALAKQFELTFAEEGYKINILSPKEDLTADNVYRDIYSNSGVDVYFATDIDAEKAVDGDYGVTLADVTESVYNQKAIKFDKTEESVTILEKLNGLDISTGICNNKYYAVPYAASIGGFAVNTKVLNQYSLSLPRTTNEMLACADSIMEKANESDVRPYTFALAGNNYAVGSYTTWVAQYGGIEEYNQYMSFQDKNGNVLENIYDVFEYDSIEKALEMIYHLYDMKTSAFGSADQDFSTAQGQVMKGTAVFMGNGDWMFNEEFKRFSKLLNDVDFIKPPLISALGVKLFGAGTEYNFDNAKCDAVLSEIVKNVDENKTVEEIKSAVDAKFNINLNIDDVQTVCERRGIVRFNLNPGLIISAKTEKKDLAAKFIRFCCSEEAGKLFAKEANTSSPWALDTPVESEYKWIQSVSAIIKNRYTKQIVSTSWGKRKQMAVSYLPNLGEYFGPTIYQQGISKYNDDLVIVANDSVYAQAARNAVVAEFENAKTQIQNGSWK